jgi:probable dihydroxyacetone kinase regulator
MSDSLITKKAIANSIKELMKKKDLQKISVSDIVEHCGINRQTFYYHFKDKYDLVNWIYYNEVVTAVVHNRNPEDWSGVMLAVLKSMQKEKYFYLNALSVSGQNAFEDYFFEITKNLLLGMVDAIEEENAITEEDKSFIAEFYSYGLVGVTVQWARKGMKQPPEEIVRRLLHVIEDMTSGTSLKYFKKNDRHETV